MKKEGQEKNGGWDSGEVGVVVVGGRKANSTSFFANQDVDTALQLQVNQSWKKKEALKSAATRT